MRIRPRRAAGSSVHPPSRGASHVAQARRRTLTWIALGERVRMISMSHEEFGGKANAQTHLHSKSPKAQQAEILRRFAQRGEDVIDRSGEDSRRCNGNV